MNSYEKIYNMLIEGQKDWSEYEDTGEFQGIPKKINRRKAPKTRTKRPRQRRNYDTAITRSKIEKAVTADETVRAKGRKGSDLYKDQSNKRESA